MTDGNEKWDAFWQAPRSADPLDAVYDPQDWAGLIWKVSLEFWDQLFSCLAPGNDLLECGCGSAVLSRYMAQRGYDCTLLDYSLEAMRVAQAGFQAGGRRGSFVIGDINGLPFHNEAFDIVYSGGVLEFCNDIELPIREMVRVLRPGGIFAATMVPRKFSIQTIADWQRTFIHAVRNLVQGKILKALTPVKLVPNHYKVNRAVLDDYEWSCRAAGLSTVVARCATPFPALSLPRPLNRAYVACMKRNLPAWNRFDARQGGWKRWVGITYKVYGIK